MKKKMYIQPRSKAFKLGLDDDLSQTESGNDFYIRVSGYTNIENAEVKGGRDWGMDSNAGSAGRHTPHNLWDEVW